jgi:Exodeoxyribonuclease V, gamma subunit
MQHNTKRATTIQVWYSNQLERLTQQLIQNLGVLDDNRADRLFAMPTIVVPNRNIATFLKYEIARGVGITTGLTFQMTEEFLETLLYTGLPRSRGSVVIIGGREILEAGIARTIARDSGVGEKLRNTSP